VAALRRAERGEYRLAFLDPSRDNRAARRRFQIRPGARRHHVGEDEIMGIISWIILGLVAGFIGSKIVNKTGSGIIIDIVLGVVGAVVGGYLVSLTGTQGITGLNLWSLLVAVLGAIVVLLVYRMVISRT
jgi:uncharacterized membrane protein YeaQ/YmgE (transglycosylase-associated protein family)